MELSKKRIFRPPLKETSGNVPLPHKRQKKPERKVDEIISKPKQNRMVGEELQQWRNSWKKIMKNSVVYFDTQGIDPTNINHQLDQKRAIKALKFVGTTITPFYDKSVSIIISKRSYSNSAHYNANDIFHDAADLKVKVWNYDKVFRFFKNLGINDFDNLSANNDGDLYNLLREEKIFGSTDKDPNAKREDLHYLNKNYLYVYDLSQNVRPIAIREWTDNFPVLHLTLDGKCPFIMDTNNSEHKKNRRLKKFEETESYRKLLKRTANELINNIKNKRSSCYLTSSSTLVSDDFEKTISQNSTRHDDNNNDDDNEQQESQEIEELDEEIQFKYPKPALMRNSSCLPNNSNKYYDVAASGFHVTSNALQFSIDSGSVPFQGNGLGPTMSQVPSKNVNNLKRRIFMKKQKQIDKVDKEMKPGYCENCRVKYDNFDDHVNSNRHKKFALEDSNFKDIDRLIDTLNDSKSFGLITSDGDYSYEQL